MKSLLDRDRTPAILSFNAGYVDTAGFLALHGLFTAHVTGNFVTFGASLAQGTSGAVTKLLALPVFCAVVILTRMVAQSLAWRETSILRLMLGLKLALLVAAAVFAVRFGPFPDGDNWRVLLTGMTLVTAMAIQNAMHRIHLASAPPTTLMTGTTTQIMIDLADLASGLPFEAKVAAKRRLARMIPAVAAFAVGCGLAALIYVAAGMWCFVLPPLVAALTFGLNLRPAAPAAGV